jgi:hypothetical protein
LKFKCIFGHKYKIIIQYDNTNNAGISHTIFVKECKKCKKCKFIFCGRYVDTNGYYERKITQNELFHYVRNYNFEKTEYK